MSIEGPRRMSPAEMAEIEKQRTLSDVEFLKHGAEYTFDEEGNKTNLNLTGERAASALIQNAEREMKIAQTPAAEKITRTIGVDLELLAEKQEEENAAKAKGAISRFFNPVMPESPVVKAQKQELRELLAKIGEPYPETAEEKRALQEKLNSPETQQKIAAHIS